MRNLVLLRGHTETTEPVRQESQAQYDQAGLPAVVKMWKEMAPYYRSVVAVYNAVFGFLVFVIFVIVLGSTANTIIISITERVQEIGTLMATGASRHKLVQMFLHEGLVLGLLGAAIGLLVAGGLSCWINHSDILKKLLIFSVACYSLIVASSSRWPTTTSLWPEHTFARRRQKPRSKMLTSKSKGGNNHAASC